MHQCAHRLSHSVLETRLLVVQRSWHLLTFIDEDISLYGALRVYYPSLYFTSTVIRTGSMTPVQFYSFSPSFKSVDFCAFPVVSNLLNSQSALRIYNRHLCSNNRLHCCDFYLTKFYLFSWASSFTFHHQIAVHTSCLQPDYYLLHIILHYIARHFISTLIVPAHLYTCRSLLTINHLDWQTQAP